MSDEHIPEIMAPEAIVDENSKAISEADEKLRGAMMWAGEFPGNASALRWSVDGIVEELDRVKKERDEALSRIGHMEKGQTAVLAYLQRETSRAVKAGDDRENSARAHEIRNVTSVISHIFTNVNNKLDPLHSDEESPTGVGS